MSVVPWKVPPHRATLSRSFYHRPTETVARELIGKVLLRRLDGAWLGGVIVETEAYLAEGDLASHSQRGKTRSNGAMFALAGTLYVYPIHAKYCMNVVTEAEGRGAAVLIRAIEPIWGTEVMRRQRGQDDPRKLARGPAMLCQALGIDRAQDGIDLVGNRQLRIAEDLRGEPLRIKQTPRIGIRQAAELPLRFVHQGNRFVSGPARDWA